MVSRAARFHDDQIDVTIGEPALELGTRQAVLLNDAPRGIGDGQLEDGLCKIDGNGCSIHVVIPLQQDLIERRPPLRWVFMLV